MQPINYPPTGTGGQKFHKTRKRGKRAAATGSGCVGYGDFIKINFGAAAYLSHDNPNAFTIDIPTGYFGYDKDCKGCVLVSSPAVSTPQTVDLTFRDDSGSLYIYTLNVVPQAQCPPQKCPKPSRRI
jgi:hypothetical protein